MDKSRNYKDISKITTYQASIYQAQAYRTLKNINNQILKKHGLTMMQWTVLGMVYDSGKTGARISDMARTLDTTQAFLTNTVNILQAKKFVRREISAKDSRSKMVILEPGHKKTILKIEQAIREDLRRTLYSQITREELNTYINFLIKIAESDTKQ